MKVGVRALHRAPCPQRGYKRRAHADSHQHLASEPSLFSESPRVSTDSKSQCWCYRASVGVAVQCCCCSSLTACCSSSNCGRATTSPGNFSTLFSKRAISKRAPRATGVFLKIASRSGQSQSLCLVLGLSAR